MLSIEIMHDKNSGYGIDVMSDKDVRYNQQLYWTHNHLEILQMVEEVIHDYRSN